MQTEFFGLTEESIFERIEAGDLLADVAKSVGKNRAMLSKWLRADVNRSARAREVRALSAQAHEERAQTLIEEAADPFELAKAKELAHHLRWRASKIDPEYGERTAIEHSGNVTLGERLKRAEGRE